MATWRVCDDESDALKSPPTNTVVYVPKHTFSLVLNRKKQKYVCVDQVSEKYQCRGFVDKYLAIFRPQTPPGMCRVVENRQIGKLELTIYKKKRIYVSTGFIAMWWRNFYTESFISINQEKTSPVLQFIPNSIQNMNTVLNIKNMSCKMYYNTFFLISSKKKEIFKRHFFNVISDFDWPGFNHFGYAPKS